MAYPAVFGRVFAAVGAAWAAALMAQRAIAGPVELCKLSVRLKMLGEVGCAQFKTCTSAGIAADRYMVIIDNSPDTPPPVSSAGGSGRQEIAVIIPE